MRKLQTGPIFNLKWPSLELHFLAQMAAFSIIPFLLSRPLTVSLKAQTNVIPLDVHYVICSPFFLENIIPGWLLPPYYILPFFRRRHQHPVGGKPNGSLQGPPC